MAWVHFCHPENNVQSQKEYNKWFTYEQSQWLKVAFWKQLDGTWQQDMANLSGNMQNLNKYDHTATWVGSETEKK